jgi:hypothetical protein
LAKIATALLGLILAVTAAPTALPLKDAPPQPKPLVIDGENNLVVDGGTYESIIVQNSSNIEIRNVHVDGAAANPDTTGLGRDCLYVIKSGNVRFHNSFCQNITRLGIVVISTTPDALVQVDHVMFENVSRYTWDLEPGLPGQHIHNFVIEDTAATESMGWGLRHTGCCDSVRAQRNVYDGRIMPEGDLPSGRY